MARTQQIEKLMESFQTIKRKLFCKNSIAPNAALKHITPSQWGVLRIIEQKDKISIKEIACHLGISSSAATQLVDGLAENGHLKMHSNPDDRRSHYIELSANAKKHIHLLRKEHLKCLSEICSILSEAELEQYLFLSGKIADHSLKS